MVSLDMQYLWASFLPLGFAGLILMDQEEPAFLAELKLTKDYMTYKQMKMAAGTLTSISQEVQEGRHNSLRS